MESRFEGYFNVCDLLHKKYNLVNAEASQDGSNVKESDGSAKQKIVELRATIQNKEELFWLAVKNSVAEGRKFVMEDIAAEYGLDTFEKRVLLLLLHRFAQ